MSTNALAFLLLNIHRDGVSLSDLTLSFDKLRNQLSATNKDTGFSGDSVDVIEHAVSSIISITILNWQRSFQKMRGNPRI